MLGWIGAPELAVLGSRRNSEFEYRIRARTLRVSFRGLLDPASSANP
jgi:hypothetical protein